MWSSYDYSKARSAQPPHELLGRVPEDGEDFAVDEKGFVGTVVEGVKYPFGFTSDVVNYPAQFDVGEEDIIICTYPKCGTTWMQQIVLLLLANGDKEKVDYPIDLAPWREMTVAKGGTEAFDAIKPSFGQNRIVWKTHAPLVKLPWKTRHAGSKMIVVGRNPFDAAISYFHHTLNIPMYNYTGDFDHFLNEIFLTGQADSDFWEWHGQHYNEIEKQKAAGVDNNLWITYEEMKADPCASVRKVAEFLGITVDDELLEKVVGSSAFDQMKEQFAKVAAAKIAEGKFALKDHIRQGQSGAWKKTLTAEQLDILTKAHKERSEKYGLPADVFVF